jgi:citrate lyase beta subunit
VTRVPLDPRVVARLDELLTADDIDRARRYPGAARTRQPVHTVYVPADQFCATTPATWAAAALGALDRHGPLSGLIDGVDDRVESLVRAKLAVEPVEDLRIDVEDGYGARADDVEDADVHAAANALAIAITEGSAPRFTGLRMKSLEHLTRRRGVRTLDLFLDTLLQWVPLPGGFRVTLPKVTSVAQVEAMAELCAALDETYRLPGLRFELQVETPQAVLGADGTALVARMLHASAGRCAGLHYGAYDYSAALGVAAAHQSMEHPVADHAKAIMQVAAAGTGVPICDGSTNVVPVGGRDEVRAAWALHARLVQRSLERGFYQGWDLHPGQLPTRYAATFAFFRAGLPSAAERLRAYRERRSSGVLDEPATAAALSGFLRRAVDCGAATEAEVTGLAGGPLDELSSEAPR